MEKFLEIYSKYRDYILSFLLFIVFMVIQGVSFWYFSGEISSVKDTIKNKNVVSKKNISSAHDKLIVDIKGEVKRPGVYYLENGKRVIDVVKKAGGFTIEADSSINNLSKKISDEMVIVIYSKEEVRDFLKLKEKNDSLLEMCNGNIVNDSCVSDENRDTYSSNNKSSNSSSGSKKKTFDDSKRLVSINTGTLEELMTLSGVGESKAKAIIEYRNKKKFETIEEIKEVSGIGDALFEKIKDNITV